MLTSVPWAMWVLDALPALARAQVAAQFYPDGFEWVERAPLPLSLGFSSKLVCLLRLAPSCVPTCSLMGLASTWTG